MAAKRPSAADRNPPPSGPPADVAIAEAAPWPPAPDAVAVEKIVSWLVEGVGNVELYRRVVAEFGASGAPRLCQAAVLQVIQAGKAGREFAIGFAMLAAAEIYRRAIGAEGCDTPPDLEVALKAVKLIATLGERLD